MSRSRKATGGAGTATPDMPEGAAPPGFPRAGARRMNIDEYYIRMEAAALPRAPGREAGSYGGLPCGTHGTADGGRRRGRRLCRDSRLGIGQKSLRELWSMPGRRGMPSRGGAFPAGKSPGAWLRLPCPVPATGRGSGRARTPCFRDFLWVFTSYFCTDMPVYLIKKFDFF